MLKNKEFLKIVCTFRNNKNILAIIFEKNSVESFNLHNHKNLRKTKITNLKPNFELIRSKYQNLFYRKYHIQKDKL